MNLEKESKTVVMVYTFIKWHIGQGS